MNFILFVRFIYISNAYFRIGSIYDLVTSVKPFTIRFFYVFFGATEAFMSHVCLYN